VTRICYTPKKFSPATLDVITQANRICRAYQAQGLDLTLRQLYYQFVSRGFIPNRQSEYSRLGSIINDARLAGALDWDFIVDRTRELRDLQHWDDLSARVASAARSFRTDKWASQPNRVEVWIEKDALIGVLEAICPAEDVPYFSCRGYTSQSEVWGAAQRLGSYIAGGQSVVILHLGDHDPSGIDMTRDIRDRLELFIERDYLNARSENMEARGLGHENDEGEFVVSRRELWESMDADCDGRPALQIKRIALNMDKVDEYNPPPNPTKLTDSRSAGYLAEYGEECWELDALEPATMVDLIRDEIEECRDADLWEEAVSIEASDREVLVEASRRWDDVASFLMHLDDPEEDQS
jgi:hypothetical protein